MINGLDKLYSNIADMPLIINACITGGVITKKQCPSLPVTDDEIIKDACKMFLNGASIVHLHIRDIDGNPTLNTLKYEYVIGGIRQEYPKGIICISSSSRFGATIEDRLALFDVGADMVSLTLGSMNFINGTSVTSPDDILAMVNKSKETNTRLELEIFDIGMLNYALYLKDKGILSSHEYLNIILGSISSSQVDLITVGNMLASVPKGWTCALGGLGKYQSTANMLGMVTGNHVRIGLEDNIKGVTGELTSNMNLISIFKVQANFYGRKFATVEEARFILNKKY